MSNALREDTRLLGKYPIENITQEDVLKDLLAGKVYVVKYPENVSGQLMRLRSGELAGLRTTSIIGEDGIVATAGMQEVKISSSIIHAFHSLRQLSHVVKQVNELSDRIGDIADFILSSKKAEFENIAPTLRDLSNRLEKYKSDSSYKTYGLTQLAAVKKTVGEYFQWHVGGFRKFTDSQSGGRSLSLNVTIDNFRYLRTHQIFKALSLIAIVELFEIVLEGSFTADMFDAAKRNVQERAAVIAELVELRYEEILYQLRAMRSHNRSVSSDYYWHQEREKEYEQLAISLLRAKDEILDQSELMDQTSMANFYASESESVFISAKDGMLILENKASDSNHELSLDRNY
jgi:hypothetical protein